MIREGAAIGRACVIGEGGYIGVGNHEPGMILFLKLLIREQVARVYRWIPNLG